MALIKCKECKKEFSKKVKKCPHCGIKNKKYTNPIVGFLGWCIVGVFVLIVLGAIVPDRSIESQNSSTENLPQHTLTSNTSLAPKDGRRIEIHVSSEGLTREQCKSLIKGYRIKAGSEGQVSVHKPSALFDNNISAWCVDNMDNKGVLFNDSLFKSSQRASIVEKPAEGKSIVSDQFSLTINEIKSGIDLHLETDLPDDTIVSITVSRSYWEKGNESEYSRSYYEFKGTLKDWQSDSIIGIDSVRWRNDLKDHQLKMKKANLEFEIDRISDEIKIRAVVPVNGQTNPLFGLRNSNLSGSAVSIKSYGRLIEHELSISKPL